MNGPVDDGRKLDDDVEGIWLRFLQDAVGSLKEAGRDIAGHGVRSALEARRGWFGEPRRRAPFRNSRIPKETAVTQALYEWLKRKKAQQIIRGVETGAVDLSGMSFGTEVVRPLPDDPDLAALAPIGDESEPTDLQIYLHKGDLDLRIEAKLLLRPQDIRLRYLGADGLGRFYDPRSPYTTSPYGGMVTYVVDRDAETWESAIAGETLAVHPGGRRIMITDAVDHLLTHHALPEGTSRHGRTEVIHFVVEVHAQPSAR